MLRFAVALALAAAALGQCPQPRPAYVRRDVEVDNLGGPENLLWKTVYEFSNEKDNNGDSLWNGAYAGWQAGSEHTLTLPGIGADTYSNLHIPGVQGATVNPFHVHGDPTTAYGEWDYQCIRFAGLYYWVLRLALPTGHAPVSANVVWNAAEVLLGIRFNRFGPRGPGECTELDNKNRLKGVASYSGQSCRDVFGSSGVTDHGPAECSRILNGPNHPLSDLTKASCLCAAEGADIYAKNEGSEWYGSVVNNYYVEDDEGEKSIFPGTPAANWWEDPNDVGGYLEYVASAASEASFACEALEDDDARSVSDRQIGECPEGFTMMQCLLCFSNPTSGCIAAEDDGGGSNGVTGGSAEARDRMTGRITRVGSYFGLVFAWFETGIIARDAEGFDEDLSRDFVSRNGSGTGTGSGGGGGGYAAACGASEVYVIA